MWIWKEAAVVRYYPSIVLVGQRKTTKPLEYVRCTGGESNLAPHEEKY
jgi:hypothetical protein